MNMFDLEKYRQFLGFKLYEADCRKHDIIPLRWGVIIQECRAEHLQKADDIVWEWSMQEERSNELRNRIPAKIG